MTRGASCLVAIAVAIAGCDGESGRGHEVQDDCVALLEWNGVAYEGASVTDPPPQGRPLVDGIVPECRPEPERPAAVAAIRGIHPSIAIATPGPPGKYPGSDIVWLGPGYLAQSPLHPLQDEMRAADSWQPASYAEDRWDCGSPRVLRVRARERPTALSGEIAVTADAETEAFIKGDDVGPYVVVDPSTVFVGLRRHGVPFIEAGVKLEVTVRECFGEEKQPGFSGLRLVVAKLMRAAAT